MQKHALPGPSSTLRYAFEHEYDYAITMDAGLTHKPEERRVS